MTKNLVLCSGGRAAMKKYYLTAMMGLLCMFALAACSADEDTDNDEPAEGAQSQESEENETEAEETGDNAEETESDSDLITESEFGDQLDLQIGDTGQVQTNLDAFEVTLESVTKETELDGEPAELDFFLIADITLTNISDDVIDADSAKGTLEMTGMLDGSGFSDLSEHGYEGIEGVEGELAPGESAEGQFVVQIMESDEYYMRIIGGLIAAGGVLNDVRWTFTESEIE